MAKLRKLGRRTDHRQAMLRNQVQSLLENGRITTTDDADRIGQDRF
jgi:large subunit ribosomal protein L17